MLQNLIRFLEDGRKFWVKQGELFMITLQEKVVALPVALYHLEKSGNHNDIDTRVSEVLLHAASCSVCLSANDMKIFIVLSQSPLKVRKATVPSYHFQFQNC